MRTLITALVAVLLYAPASRSQCNETVLSPVYTLNAGAEFGYSVSVRANTLVVGAPGQDVPGRGTTGAVTVYRQQHGAWTGTALPLPPDVVPGDRFGHSVSIDTTATWIAVGAPDQSNSRGAAYFYFWNFLSQSWSLSGSVAGPYAGGWFGFSVDMGSGPLVAVGGPYSGPAIEGAAWVYRQVSGLWVMEAFLQGETTNDRFGWDVAIDGYLVVGAPYYDQIIPDLGKFYVYHKPGASWVLDYSAVPSGQWQAHAGMAVDVQGDFLVVGIPDYDSSLPNAGGVSRWSHSSGSWVYLGFLTSNGNGDRMGAAVVADPTHCFEGHPNVSSMRGSNLGTQGGGITALPWNQNSFELAWSASEVTSFDHFGSALAADGNLVLVGSPGRVVGRNADAGRAYLYDLSISGTSTDLGMGLAGHNGQTPRLSYLGSFCGRTQIVLNLDQARPGGLTFFFGGASTLNAPFKGGTLVPQPSLLMPIGVTSGAGSLSFGAMWGPGLGAIDFYSQCWIVDPAGPRGMSASNAIRISSLP